MELVTLSSLRTQTRELADMVNSSFVSDAEFNRYIDKSYAELYDILVSRFEDYYTKQPVTFQITSGNTYDLPSDFYKLRGIDKSLSGSGGANDWLTVNPFNFQERNTKNSVVRRSLSSSLSIAYRIVGEKIHFLPEDACTGTYRIWYIPRRTLLSTDTDTVDAIQGWHEFIVVDAAIKAKTKEETDVQELLIMKKDLLTRIESMATQRDAGFPEKVADVAKSYNDIDLPFLR